MICSSSFASASSAEQVGVHELRPRQRGARHDRPVRRALVDDLARLLDRGQPVAAGADRIEVLEQAGGDGPGQRDARGVVLAEREDALAEPRRHVVERVLGGVLDPRALDPRVEPADVDELGAAPVGALGQRADQPLLAGLAADGHDLALLQVAPEADREVGEPLERGVVHGRRNLAGAAMARRRGRDSNPRCRGYPHNGFRDRDKALHSPHETWSRTAGGIPGGMKAQVARPRDSAATHLR